MNGEFFGGEVSSRILYDEKKTWLELRYICESLKELGATINDTCSNHIWVNLSNIKNERYFFEVLAKIITIYEMEIEHFYMGDAYRKRESSYDYARSLTGHLLNHINNVDFNKPDYFYKFINDGTTFFTVRDGVNLQKYQNRKMIEIRYPNGSINESTIQNNINFTLKLILAIVGELFDPSELTNIINKDKEIIFNKWIFNETSLENFEYLAKTISRSAEDLNDFMSQYEKVLATKKL